MLRFCPPPPNYFGLKFLGPPLKLGGWLLPWKSFTIFHKLILYFEVINIDFWQVWHFDVKDTGWVGLWNLASIWRKLNMSIYSFNRQLKKNTEPKLSYHIYFSTGTYSAWKIHLGLGYWLFQKKPKTGGKGESWQYTPQNCSICHFTLLRGHS